MVSVFVARAMAGGVISLSRQLKRLRHLVELWAHVKEPTGEVEGENSRGFIVFETYVNGSELDELLSDEKLVAAWRRARAMKSTGFVPTCEGCGTVCTSTEEAA